MGDAADRGPGTSIRRSLVRAIGAGGNRRGALPRRVRTDTWLAKAPPAATDINQNFGGVQRAGAALLHDGASVTEQRK
jgi:hypothetical protein